MNIGHNLRRWRIALGLTQEQLAAEWGITRQTLYRWENNFDSGPPVAKYLELEQRHNDLIKKNMPGDCPYLKERYRPGAYTRATGG